MTVIRHRFNINGYIQSKMYPQRYKQHFPAAGEVVTVDRNWYNRAGVEHDSQIK